MHTRSKGNKDQIRFLNEIEAFARRNHSRHRQQEQVEEEVDSISSNSLSNSFKQMEMGKNLLLLHLPE
jgi:hypothetical protein